MTSDWSWDTAHETTGSGIIIVKKFYSEWKPLGLWAYGGFDIPKGHVEPGDNIFETALRETIEEAGISEINFYWGYDYTRIDNLFVYVGSTSEEPKIKFNKEEGLFEHEYAKWINWEEMKSNCYDYLVPAIKWAEEKVCNFK